MAYLDEMNVVSVAQLPKIVENIPAELRDIVELPEQVPLISSNTIYVRDNFAAGNRYESRRTGIQARTNYIPADLSASHVMNNPEDHPGFISYLARLLLHVYQGHPHPGIAPEGYAEWANLYNHPRTTPTFLLFHSLSPRLINLPGRLAVISTTG